MIMGPHAVVITYFCYEYRD